jgi:hypothetical protein
VHNDTGKQLPLSTVPGDFRATGVVMMLASLGAAGDTRGITTNADRVPTTPTCDNRQWQQPGGLDMCQPDDPA